jgi:ribonuclease HI
MSKRLSIFTDGGARGNPGPAGIGVHVIDELGNVVFQDSQYIGRATNNEAEYRAVLASLEWLVEYVKTETVEHIQWNLDSMLVVQHLSKQWKIKEARLQQLADSAWNQLTALPCSFTFKHVPRAQNSNADALVNQALDAAAL